MAPSDHSAGLRIPNITIPGQVVSTSPKQPGAESPARLALLWRSTQDGPEVYVTAPQPGRGPLVGYNHLPRLNDDAPLPKSAVAAGHFKPMGWRPTEASTEVWAIRRELQPQGALRGLIEGQPGSWLRPSDAVRAHVQGLMVLSPMAWSTIQNLCAVLDDGAAGPSMRPAQDLFLAAAQALCGQAESLAIGVGMGLAALPLLSPTLPPQTHTNCYVLGHKRLTLVDPGTPYPHEQQLLLNYLKQQVHAGAVIEAVWITHHHADHVGAAALVRDHFGAQVLSHEATQGELQGQVHIDRTIDDNTVLQVEDARFTALHTPGHARGHLCFWAHDGGHLISGDNVLGVGTPIVPPMPHGDMASYIEGLQRLSALPLGMLLPGHGPAQAQAARRVSETLLARLQREALLLGTLGQMDGPQTLAALVSKVYRGLGPSLRGLAELSTLSHLQKLVHDGRIHEVRLGGMAAWRLTIAHGAPLL